MDNDQRRKLLIKVLADKQRLSVEQLVGMLHASPATVRRDISWLSGRGLLQRTRGGAEHRASEHHHALAGETFQQNLGVHSAEKRAIARYAAGMCQNGETIIINGGTTTFMMVEFLINLRMTIVTNSFLMAEQLLRHSENEIIIPGGHIYRDQNVILSPFESDVIQHHYASRMFMGAAALSPMGVLEWEPLLVQAEKRLLTQANELVVLADSSKLSVKRASLILCGLDRIYQLITDTGLGDAAAQMLERAGVKVVAVTPDTA
ncbi:DeoR/GlpR transcriptional regulator [Solimonas sp. K1W22B-7]|uniref:DeoR/GlpR family DNA-binding transcription regulator n=1 Tax=Solimonas sp. K1W22B-7 TaxID=2303331 RepID=UPI000E3348CB|nr:DeoR/GlpR family DNA-binding transcription regulator [Solimonas sp. K1W22B-7]AXQ30608.1 DeoR/GlpR transcriptional regulator [Solimonas sp. K1W22B-7]